MKWRNFCSLLSFALMMTWVSTPMVFAQSIMVEKNLFSPDRKPPSDKSASRPTSRRFKGLPPRSIQLDGVFVHEGNKTALLRVRKRLLGKAAAKDRNPFPYLTVHEGGSVGDFEVVKIDPSSVTIARNGQQFVISLFAEGKVVPPAAKLPTLPVKAPAAQKRQSKGAPKAKAGQRTRSPVPSPPTAKPASRKGTVNRVGTHFPGRS